MTIRLLLLSISTLLLGGGCSHDVSVSDKDVSDEFVQVAETIAAPTFSDHAAAKTAFTDTDVILRQEITYQRLGSITCQDSDLDAFRHSALRRYSACNETLLTLRRLDRNVPDYEGIADKLLTASPAIYKSTVANADEPPTYSQDELYSLVDFAAKSLGETLKLGTT